MKIKRILSLMTLLIPFTPSGVAADGAMIPPSHDDELREPSQDAIIHLQDGVERLYILVEFDGRVNSFFWVLPFPSEPEVEEADMRLFTQISEMTQPHYNYYDYSMDGCGGCGEAYTLAADDGEGVDIVDTGTVGILYYEVILADDTEPLVTYLNDEGFETPEDLIELFSYYLEKEWNYFVTFKISLEEAEYEYSYGFVQPVKFTFSSEKPVYPMKISSYNKGGTRLLLFSVSNRMSLFKGATILYDREFSDSHDFNYLSEYPAVAEEFETPFFLTKLTRYYQDPGDMEDIELFKVDELFAGAAPLTTLPLFPLPALLYIIARRIRSL